MSDIQTAPLKVTGKGHCRGGVEHHPPFHDYPLLAWMPNHDKHGDHVFTEDQKASVHDIAQAIAETSDYETVAAKFDTTVEHVSQAVDYALKAGFLGQ